MTVQTNKAIENYAGNGVTLGFGVGFRFLDNSHILVTLTDPDGIGVVQVETTNYTLTGAGDQSGGTVTMVVAPPAGYTLTIQRNMPFTQLVDYKANDPFPEESAENIADERTMEAQQINEQLGRALLFPPQSSGFSNVLPTPDAGTFLGWNASETGLINGSPAGSGDLLLRSDLAAVGAGQGASLVTYTRQDGTGISLQSAVRDKIASNRNYYVRTDGNDANTGLSNTAGAAFLTIQRAVDVVMKGVDTSGLNVTISVANGTYAGGVVVNGPIPGGGTLYIVGNTVTPASCVVTATSADAFLANSGAQILVTGFKVQTTTSGNGINAINGSAVTVGAMDFGVCANSHVNASTSTVAMTANYAITGGGESHLHVGAPGLITFGAVTATLTGTPAFSAYFAGVAQGSIIATSATFTGAATGSRYLAHNGGIILAHPGFANPFPGSVPGWADTGGLYKAGVAQGIQVASERDSGAYVDFQVWNGAGSTYTTILRLQTDPSGTGRGYLFANGDDSYSSGRTSLGTATRVQANVGSNDGITVNSTGTRMEASANGAAIGWLRRRTSDGAIFDFLRDNTFVGSITVTAAATQYNVASDERVKFDIAPAAYDPEWIFRAAGAMRTFRMAADPDHLVTGPIAQLLAPVCPGAVTKGDANPKLKPGDEGFELWGVDNSKLVAELLLEVAELRRRLDAAGI